MPFWVRYNEFFAGFVVLSPEPCPLPQKAHAQTNEDDEGDHRERYVAPVRHRYGCLKLFAVA
jgi:hypothetical protein